MKSYEQLNIHELATSHLIAAEELCAIAATTYEYAAEHCNDAEFIVVLRFIAGNRNERTVRKFVEIAKRALDI